MGLVVDCYLSNNLCLRAEDGSGEKPRFLEEVVDVV